MRTPFIALALINVGADVNEGDIYDKDKFEFRSVLTMNLIKKSQNSSQLLKLLQQLGSR